MSLRVLIAIACLFFGGQLQAIELRFDSGFPKVLSWEGENFSNLPEEIAVSELLSKEFNFSEPWEWRLIQRIEDSTHVHLAYELWVQGHPVFLHRLKIHYNRAGYVDYLTNTLPDRFEVPAIPKRNSWEERKESVLVVLLGGRKPVGTSRGRFGLWLNEESLKADWAFDVEAVPLGPEVVQRGIVGVDAGQVLYRRKMVHHFEEERLSQSLPSIDVFLNAPTNVDTSLADYGQSTVSVTTEVAGTLKNPICHVQFDSLKKNLNEVNPQSYVPTTLNPTKYRSDDCRSVDNPAVATNCLNQKLDSGNVYYHVTGYRQWLNVTAAGLGTTLNFSYDPIRVVVDFMSKSIQEDILPENQSNNAAYIGGLCTDSGSIDHCLVFLQPKPRSCGGKLVDLYSLAREAMVVAHEYQHYVTDMITGIEFISDLSVSDVLHEGYSDYFGASYTAQVNNNQSLTTVGAYAFQECSQLQRNLNTKPVFNNEEVYSSGHKPGLVWASALWELRGLLGKTETDALTLKSLYFLSARPGFIDSVEALVQADKSLYQGAHESRIRTLFFDERKFLGSLTGAFQDSDKKILKVGFQGCSSIPSRSQGSGLATVCLLMAWLAGTLLGGRWLRRQV